MAHTKQEFVAEYILNVRPPTGAVFFRAVKYAEELYEELIKLYPEIGTKWDGRSAPVAKATREATPTPGVTGGSKKKKK